MIKYRWQLVLLNLCLVALVAALQLLVDYSPNKNTPLSRINSVLYDLRFQWFPPQRATPVPIVIIDIDEASLQEQGRWPWDRAKIAKLIQSLQENGVALIGFDVVFSEKSQNPVTTLLESYKLPSDINNALIALVDQFDSDSKLSQSLGFNTVLGYFFHADGGSVGTLPAPIMQFDIDVAAQLSLSSMPDYTANLSDLTNNALSSGFVVAVPDSDGIVRRMPLIMMHENGVYPSLSLEMTRIALGAPWIRLNTSEYNDRTIIEGVRIGRQLSIPLDENGNMLVAYKGGAKSFTTISATRILADTVGINELNQLDGAIVLIGTSALGLSDLRTMPLQTGYPGVEVHANVIDTLIQAAIYNAQEIGTQLIPLNAEQRNPIYYRPDWEPGASLTLLLFLGIVLAIWLPGRQPIRMVLIGSTWLGLVILTNVLMWHWWHLALPMALQILLVSILVAVNVVAGYLITNQQKRAVQNLFGEYVPPEYVEQMLANPENISLEGEQREMTVLFADVRQFTAVSESLSAAELKQLLNRYLSAITEVIFNYHGTIDKYVGDMVMAFWNAPLDDAEHANNGLKAAIAMQKRMVQLRKEFKHENLPELYIGIGLNTGQMNVGDMGSSYRRAYTVLGDAVNLASRLESLTAYYGVPILISDTTRYEANTVVDHLTHSFKNNNAIHDDAEIVAYRIIDRVRVKGKNQALDISQPLIGDVEIDGIAIDDLDKYTLGLEHYYASQWDNALDVFKTLSFQYPNQKLYKVYIDRINNIKNDVLTIPDDWDGVYTHETK